MNKKIKKHILYYLFLLVILFLGLILTLLASPNIQLQSSIVFLTVFFYAMFGILHHLINHELTAKIMIEYILIGTLGISILFFAVSGGIL